MRVPLVLIFVLTFSLGLQAQGIIKARSASGAYKITKTTLDSTRLEGTEKRVALVIGNKDYKIGPLQNPENDANDLTILLNKKQFEVIKVVNGTRLEMREAIKSFSQKIADGAIGLFYYSGHGVQVEGENYLVPIDAKIEYKEEVPDECIGVSTILRYMEASNNKLNIMILDACRNSPFRSFSRSGEKGMMRMEAPVGSFVAYSTSPGMTASDGNGRNGLYTSKLMKYLDVPGLKIEEVFKQVRIEVGKESNNSQIPWESNSLMGDFYFTLN
jgi:uncharacterized caspase-like protein